MCSLLPCYSQQVFDFLQAQDILNVGDHCTALSFGLQTTYCFLQRNCFEQGKRTGNMKMKTSIIVAQDQYFIEFSKADSYQKKIGTKKSTSTNCTYIKTIVITRNSLWILMT